MSSRDTLGRVLDAVDVFSSIKKLTRQAKVENLSQRLKLLAQYADGEFDDLLDEFDRVINLQAERQGVLAWLKKAE